MGTDPAPCFRRLPAQPRQTRLARLPHFRAGLPSGLRAAAQAPAPQRPRDLERARLPLRQGLRNVLRRLQRKARPALRQRREVPLSAGFPGELFRRPGREPLEEHRGLRDRPAAGHHPLLHSDRHPAEVPVPGAGRLHPADSALHPERPPARGAGDRQGRALGSRHLRPAARRPAADLPEEPLQAARHLGTAEQKAAAAHRELGEPRRPAGPGRHPRGNPPARAQRPAWQRAPADDRRDRLPRHALSVRVDL